MDKTKTMQMFGIIMLTFNKATKGQAIKLENDETQFNESCREASSLTDIEFGNVLDKFPRVRVL